MKLLKFSDWLTEMKITAIPFKWNWVKWKEVSRSSQESGAAKAKFFSDLTDDDYEVFFSPYTEDSIIVEFNSRKLKSDLNAQSSPSVVSKILSTVFSIMSDYLEKWPDKILSFTGSDAKRSRVYKLFLDSNKSQFSDLHYRFDGEEIFIASKSKEL